MELLTETVIGVHHWSSSLFSIRTTRDQGLRFRNGEFAMMGIEVDGKPLTRAYSMASSNYEEHLEFYSIKISDGSLTSRLQHIQVGDQLLVSKKPTGSLLYDSLLPGQRLYLLCTGTGLAPFLSIIKDPEVYERYDKVILVHGCRYINELTYQQLITQELHQNPYFGHQVSAKLIYYPVVTREPFRNYGRITTLLENGKLIRDIGLPPLSVDSDRFMLCGSPAMLENLTGILDTMGFAETRKDDHHEYVIERAFVEK
jgi:ferredoxin/flavodoxin---NADP+ reductase